MSAAATPESIEFLQNLQSGQRLAGCYLLIKPIQGAPDRTIWLANDEVLAKDVALHFLPQELVGRADVAERLKQEVKRSRPLIHPHILRTYDFIEEEGWSAISTDAFEGPTLAGLLQDGAREVAEIQPWVEQICSTLQEAHRIRIVHAGLSPHEVAIDATREVRLMNFGVSAVLRDALRTLDSSAQNRTLSYASPEQLEGAKAGVADDIFAVAAVVHELLSGEPPFSGADRSTPPPTIAAHREALGHRGDPVPAAWESAVAAALSGDATARPATAGHWWQLVSAPVVFEASSSGDSEASTPAAAVAAGAEIVNAATAEVPTAAETEESASSETPSRADVEQGQVEAGLETPAPEEFVHNATETHILPVAESEVAPGEAAPEASMIEEQKAEASPGEFAVENVVPEPVQPVESVAQPRSESALPSKREDIPITSQEVSPEPSEATTSPMAEAVKPNEQVRVRETDRRFVATDAKSESRQPSNSKPLQKKRISLGAASAKSTSQPITPVDADTLADEVRREEAEQEARELGYLNNDTEEYLPRRRGPGGSRLALPIIGAVFALAALFWVIRMLVGTPDPSSRDVATNTPTNDPAQSGSPAIPAVPSASPAQTEPTVPTETPTTGSVPGDSKPRIDVSAESPRTNVAVEPPPVNPPPIPQEPVKSAAEEHEVALQKVRELETKLAETKKAIGEKTKSLPQILKSAGELTAQQKKKDEEARKTEQAAAQAEQLATDKRRVADEAKKAATALAEETKARQEEHGKTKELLQSLQASLQEDQKALADATSAAAAAATAAKQAEEEGKKTAATDTETTTKAPLPSEREDSEAAKARNDERKRIDDEMAALRQKLAEQAQKLGAALDAARAPEPARNPDPAPAPQPTKAPEPAAQQPSKTESSTARTEPSQKVSELALNQSDVPSLPEAAPSAPDQPKKATAPDGLGEYMNSLGMKFARLPSAEPLFCIWPTRVRDFEAFARSTGLKSTLWKDPGFKQGPEHPVVNVTWQEAIAFCKWLTAKEQKEGLISADQVYRLPTDLEWSLAVGLSNESGRTPEERDMSIPDVYPWGNSWPPPAGAGNYTGEETGSDVAIKGYDDAFPWTSPVGSFPANSFGLFDMGGNVWEWCMDTWNSQSKARVLRGASWYNGALKLSLLSSCRVHASPDSGTDNYGFRVVIAGLSGKSKR